MSGEIGECFGCSQARLRDARGNCRAIPPRKLLAELPGKAVSPCRSFPRTRQSRGAEAGRAESPRIYPDRPSEARPRKAPLSGETGDKKSFGTATLGIRDRLFTRLISVLAVFPRISAFPLVPRRRDTPRVPLIPLINPSPRDSLRDSNSYERFIVAI